MSIILFPINVFDIRFYPNSVYLYPCNSYIPPERFFENFGNYNQRAAAGWKEWDATESAQMWYGGTIDNEGMVLPQRIGFAKRSSRLERDKFPHARDKLPAISALRWIKTGRC